MGVLNSIKNTRIEAEWSLSNSGDILGKGMFLHLFSQPSKRINTSATLYYADENFQGYLNNSINFTGYFNFNISSKASVTFNLDQDEYNASRDTIYEIAPSYRNFQGALNFRVSPRSRLNISLRYREKKDRSSRFQFHNDEIITRLQLSQRFDKFQFSLSGEIGQTRDLFQRDEEGVIALRGYLDTKYVPSPNNYFRFFIQYFDRYSASAYQQKQFVYGIGGQTRIARKTNVYLNYQNNFSLTQNYRNRNLFEFRLNHQINRQNAISLETRYHLIRRTLDATEFSIAAHYLRNFGFNVNAKRNLPSVFGQIMNSEGEYQEGISLSLEGVTAVTDEYGKFTFSRIVPGEYIILIDRTSIGFQQIPDIPLPIKISVEENRDTELYFGIIESAQLKGQLLIKNDPEAEQLVPSEQPSLPPLLVELGDGTESFTQLTDTDGKFSFTELRPGKWTVTIHQNPSFSDFDLEIDQRTVELSPGDREFLDFYYLPRKRTIRFQELSLNNRPLKQPQKSILAQSPARNSTSSRIVSSPKVPQQSRTSEKKDSGDSIIYSIQLAALSKRSKTQNTFKGAEKFGSIYTDYQVDFNKVKLGYFTSYEEAFRILKEVRSIGYADAFITTDQSKTSIGIPSENTVRIDNGKEGKQETKFVDVKNEEKTAMRNNLNPDKSFFIQLAALVNRDGDLDEYVNLSNLGSIYKIEQADFRKIKLGQFSSRKKAEEVLQYVKSAGHGDAFITYQTFDPVRMELISKELDSI
jgi:cell division septation protein DedD